VTDPARHQQEVIRTYLVMDRADQLRPGAPPTSGASLVELDPCSVSAWRDLYARIGGPWHWHDRDAWSDERLEAHLRDNDVRVFRARIDLPEEKADPAGFVELVRHDDRSVEIAYIGLDDRLMGRGLGRWLVSEATTTAWAWGANRVWLHTCTLDADAALPNYLARGFRPTRTERYVTEIARR
jgi:GNAT superfamily N-acetyltransferase